jgi:AcrR family transcriptional regulator
VEEALRRKEREREAHRREILGAAERVFARDGYPGATMEAIAQEAEFAVGTLYNFFEGKEQLYAAVVTGLMEEFMARFEEQVLGEPDPARALEELIALRLTHFEAHRGFARAFFEATPGSRMSPDRALPAGCAAWRDRYVEAVSGLFARAIEAGAVEAFDPVYLTLALNGVLNACIGYWTRREPTEPLAERLGKLKTLVLRRLAGAPSRLGPPQRASAPAKAGRHAGPGAGRGARAKERTS